MKIANSMEMKLAPKKRINPTDVKSRYLWVLSNLADNLTIEHPKPLTFTELKKYNNISKRRFCEVLIDLENGGYIKRLEINRRPYYTLWKWGVLLLEANSLNAMGILEMMYELEVK